MIRKYRWTLGLATTAFLAFVATEGAVFSMAKSAVVRLGDAENDVLFDTDRVHSLSDTKQFSLLAAGDIAACRVDGGIDRLNRNIRYSFGMKRPALEPNQGMVLTTAILEAYPDLDVLALGDLAYKRGEPVAFSDCYDPFWGQAKHRTWPTPGNHEYQSLGAFGYFDYWGERAGPDRAGYYALRVGNWIILSLNSEIDASQESDQADWIDMILADNPGACLGAFFHRPAYSAVERDKSENAKLLFSKVADAGAIFVLNGHNHFFERTVPLDADGRPSVGGTTVFVSGTGGKVTNGPIPDTDRTAELITNTPGMVKLDFSDKAVSWSYLTGDASVTPSQGVLTCS
jgi:hypothetical protein